MTFSIDRIESMIYNVQGYRVMLDSDLANLYGVDTKALTRQVRRNISRFPTDFMFEPDSEGLKELRRQFGASNPPIAWKYMRRSVPMLFTENGVAMLSSVLSSEQAVQINIVIIRTFTKLRSFLMMENSNDTRFEDLEANQKATNKLFKIVFKKLDNLEEHILPKLPANRKKIGLKT
jgi:hypothetical protein